MQLTLLVLAATCAAGAAERRISIADYRDRMAGAWIGQSVGVAYGWPTEFRFCGTLVPPRKMPKWKPEMINETFSQDDLYVEMTFLDTLDRRGLDVSPRLAGIDFGFGRGFRGSFLPGSGCGFRGFRGSFLHGSGCGLRGIRGLGGGLFVRAHERVSPVEPLRGRIAAPELLFELC